MHIQICDHFRGPVIADVRRKRRLVMSVLAALLVLASSADGDRVIPSVTVKGNIATRVVFKGAAGETPRVGTPRRSC